MAMPFWVGEVSSDDTPALSLPRQGGGNKCWIAGHDNFYDTGFTLPWPSKANAATGVPFVWVPVSSTCTRQ